MTLVRGRKKVVLEVLDGFTGKRDDVLRGDATFAPVTAATGTGTGDVVGPSSATADHVVTFNGTTGKVVKDSGVAIAAVVVTTDPRLTDARTPTAHHTSHESGGSDALTLAEAQVTNLVGDLATLAAGVAAAEITAHKNAASGYAGLDASSKLTGSQQKYGSAANTACEGNDTRLSDARTPTAHKTSHQDGGTDEINVGGLSGVLADPQPPIIGAGATQAVAGNDARLTDARTPVAHASSHQAGGSDPLLVVARTSNTGTQNNFNVTGRFTKLLCDGAAPFFTGFTVASAAPSDGDRIVLEYTGTGTMRVGHQDTGSTAANRVIGESTRGQIVGVGGSITLDYDGTTARWRITAVNPGKPIPVAFSAGDFTGFSPMTWTVDSGDVLLNAYQQRGTILTWFVTVASSTLGGTASGIVLVALPNGFTVANNGTQVGPYGRLQDNGVTYYVAIAAAVPASTTTQILLLRFDQANLTLTTNNFNVQGTIVMVVD